MHVIIGLGNPGEQYENTRHNIGFMAIDALAKELNLKWENSKKFKAEIAKNHNAILVKPQTYMNNSGQAVAAVLSYYLKRPPDKGGWGDLLAKILTVIHDDLDIELGKFIISIDSRSAGHKGVESIINYLKTKNFKRIRVGIHTPALENVPADSTRSPRLSSGEAGRNGVEAAKFVLQKFNAEELKTIQNLIIKITEEIK